MLRDISRAASLQDAARVMCARHMDTHAAQVPRGVLTARGHRFEGLHTAYTLHVTCVLQCACRLNATFARPVHAARLWQVHMYVQYGKTSTLWCGSGHPTVPFQAPFPSEPRWPPCRQRTPILRQDEVRLASPGKG